MRRNKTRRGRIEFSDLVDNSLPYERLREAIILQGIKDLKSDDDTIREKAERWFLSYPEMIPDAITERIIKEFINGRENTTDD